MNIKDLRAEHQRVFYYRSYIDHAKLAKPQLDFIKQAVTVTFQGEDEKIRVTDDRQYNWERNPLCNILVAYTYTDKSIYKISGK